MGNNNSSVRIFPNDINTRLIKDTNGRQESVGITEIENVNFNENIWDNINKGTPKEIDFCLLENELNGIEECAGLFIPKYKNTEYVNPPYLSEFDKYRITKGESTCYSYLFRPGLVFDPKDIEKARELFGNENVISGKKCKIEFQDYNYNDTEYVSCCTILNSPDSLPNEVKNCNINLVNGYKTNHCNIAMIEYCSLHPNNDNCLLWLENSNKRNDITAFQVYSEYCKKNHNDESCEYFCKISRENNSSNSSYCDLSLKEWCSKNPNDSNCFCVLTPSDKIPNLEKYLGPKECWLANCSSQGNMKWLTTEQINTRSNCQITSCIIDVNSLIMNEESELKMINNCVSGVSVSAATYNNLDVNKVNKIFNHLAFPFSMDKLLISSSILILLMILKK